MLRQSKVIAQTDRQTGRRTVQKITSHHTQAGVTVKNIPTREIIPPVYFRVRKSVKNILGVCFCVRQYVMGNTYDML